MEVCSGKQGGLKDSEVTSGLALGLICHLALTQQQQEEFVTALWVLVFTLCPCPPSPEHTCGVCVPPMQAGMMDLTPCAAPYKPSTFPWRR